MRQIRTSSSMSGRWKRACSLQAPRHLSTLLKAIQNLTRHANIETLCKHYVDDTEPASPYLAIALA